MEEDTGVKGPQAKECVEPPEAPQSKEQRLMSLSLEWSRALAYSVH